MHHLQWEKSSKKIYINAFLAGSESLDCWCSTVDTTMMKKYLQGLVMSLQLPTQTFQLAASQDGLAVISLEVKLLLHDLRLLLLNHL